MWSKLEEPNWSYFRAGFGVVALGLGGLAFVRSIEVVSLALVCLGLLMVVHSLRPTIQSLPWIARRRQEEEDRARRQAEEEGQRAKRQAEEEEERARRQAEEEASERLHKAEEEKRRAEEERRRQWEPLCLAWDKFQPEAGALVVAMDNFRYENKPDDWREIMVEKSRAALLLAESLAQTDRQEAEKLISPFSQANGEETPERFAMPLKYLRDWLFERGRIYSQVKQEIGLLTPPAQPSPAPP